MAFTKSAEKVSIAKGIKIGSSYDEVVSAFGKVDNLIIALQPEPEETATPTPEPEEIVTSKPEETTAPFSTELPILSDTVQRGMQPVPNLNAASDSLSKQGKGRKNLSVTGLRVSTKDGRNVTLRWKVNTAAQYYKIYRAGRKNGSYKVIRTLSGNQKKLFCG